MPVLIKKFPVFSVFPECWSPWRRASLSKIGYDTEAVTWKILPTGNRNIEQELITSILILTLSISGHLEWHIPFFMRLLAEVFLPDPTVSRHPKCVPLQARDDLSGKARQDDRHPQGFLHLGAARYSHVAAHS